MLGGLPGKPVPAPLEDFFHLYPYAPEAVQFPDRLQPKVPGQSPQAPRRAEESASEGLGYFTVPPGEIQWDWLGVEPTAAHRPS